MDGSVSELMANVCRGWCGLRLAGGGAADGQSVPGGCVDRGGGGAGLMAAAVGTAV